MTTERSPTSDAVGMTILVQAGTTRCHAIAAGKIGLTVREPTEVAVFSNRHEVHPGEDCRADDGKFSPFARAGGTMF